MSHATCHHVNTAAANSMCESFRRPQVLVAFGGSAVREHMHRNQANSAMKRRMDRNA